VPIYTTPINNNESILSIAIDDNLFRNQRSQEYLQAIKNFPLLLKESIKSRLKLVKGCPNYIGNIVLNELNKRPIICREYTPNAPPPLPLAPIAIPKKEGTEPPHVKQWPISNAIREVKIEMLKKWKEYNIIESANSFGNIPIFPIKETKKYRLLMDARKVNELL